MVDDLKKRRAKKRVEKAKQSIRSSDLPAKLKRVQAEEFKLKKAKGRRTETAKKKRMSNTLKAIDKKIGKTSGVLTRKSNLGSSVGRMKPKTPKY